MALRTDQNSWMIYDPNDVSNVFKALEAAALVQFGGWLQAQASRMPLSIRDNLGQMGVVMAKVGDARQQIQAGLSVNEVDDSLVTAQRGWDRVVRWMRNPGTVPVDEVADVVDQLAAALTYLDERTMETGTNHPRWNSRLVSGEPCPSCGRN